MRRGQVRSVCRARQCQVPTRPAQGRGTAGSPSCCPRLLPAAGRERLVSSQGEGGGSTRPVQGQLWGFPALPQWPVVPSLSRLTPAALFVLKVLLSTSCPCAALLNTCWRRAVSTLWADFVRDNRQRCSQSRTKGKGQRDTQSEKDRDMHRRSETERSTEVETSRDTERQRHFLQALSVSQGRVCCACIRGTFRRKCLRFCGLAGGLSHSLPRDRSQWQGMGARGQQSLRVHGRQ